MNKWSIMLCLFILSLAMPTWAETPSPAIPLTPQTLYYFDKDWQITTTPTADGFYRKVLATQADGYLVQDFYQASNKKQSDPILLTNEEDLIDGAPKSINGQLILWHENGQKSMQVLYKNGQKQGLLTSWYNNGNKEIEQQYVDDRENGKAIYWNEQGQKNLEFNFKDGNFDVISVWKDNKKMAEKHYQNGKREGISTYWYNNGTEKAIEHYHNNKLNGIYTSFYPDGKKQSEFNYKDNTPIEMTFWYTNNQKAAYLTRNAPEQLNCSIWDEQASIIYQGDNTERCILTVRNIFDSDIIIK